MQVTAYQDKNGGVHLKQEDQVRADVMIELDVVVGENGCTLNNGEDLLNLIRAHHGEIRRALEVI
jgi:hypothetical protein